MIDLRSNPKTIEFKVYVLPRSSRTAIVGSHKNALKIKLTAPPVDGAANKQCIEVLAKALGVPKSSLSIVTGQSSRSKRIRLRPLHAQWEPSLQRALEKKVRQLAAESG